MKKILINSGPQIALFDKSDAYHQASFSQYLNQGAFVTLKANYLITVLYIRLGFHLLCNIGDVHWFRQVVTLDIVHI